MAVDCIETSLGVFKMKRTLMLAVSAVVLTAPTIAQDLPPGNPLPGECFARVIVPATYETSTEQVVLRQASERIVKIPARFETVTERIVVQEPSYQIVPVGYGNIPSTVTVGSTTYTINTAPRVINANGVIVGTVDCNGNVIALDGSMMARNAVNFGGGNGAAGLFEVV